MCRWPTLKRYRVGTFQQARADSSRPDVLAKGLAGLELCYRDLDVQHGSQKFNFDDMHVRSRDLLVGCRTTVVAPRELAKPEIFALSIGRALSGGTAAFTVSAGGVIAPYFCVVEGSSDGHAYAVVTAGGMPRYVPLAERLNEGTIVQRCQPAGMHTSLFDAYAAPSPRERTSRQRAAKQRRQVQTPGRMLPVREAWCICGAKAVAMVPWKQRLAGARSG